MNLVTQLDTPLVEKSEIWMRIKKGKLYESITTIVGMIGDPPFYLTASRPDLQFAICMWPGIKALGLPDKAPKCSKKRSFRTLRRNRSSGSFCGNPKDSSLWHLTAFFCRNADHAGCKIHARIRSGSVQLLVPLDDDHNLSERHPRFHFIKEHVLRSGGDSNFTLCQIRQYINWADICQQKSWPEKELNFLATSWGNANFTPDTLKINWQMKVMNMTHGQLSDSQIRLLLDRRIGGFPADRLSRLENAIFALMRSQVIDATDAQNQGNEAPVNDSNTDRDAIVEPSFTRPPNTASYRHSTTTTTNYDTGNHYKLLARKSSNFASLFGFDHRTEALEDTFSQNSSKPIEYALYALSSIPGTVDHS
ncbi:hypothetical protein Tco_0390506 [Tanacetum coccineum]